MTKRMIQCSSSTARNRTHSAKRHGEDERRQSPRDAMLCWLAMRPQVNRIETSDDRARIKTQTSRKGNAPCVKRTKRLVGLHFIVFFLLDACDAVRASISSLHFETASRSMTNRYQLQDFELGRSYNYRACEWTRATHQTTRESFWIYTVSKAGAYSISLRFRRAVRAILRMLSFSRLRSCCVYRSKLTRNDAAFNTAEKGVCRHPRALGFTCALQETEESVSLLYSGWPGEPLSERMHTIDSSMVPGIVAQVLNPSSPLNTSRNFFPRIFLFSPQHAYACAHM
jgi:hypothetical protein